MARALPVERGAQMDEPLIIGGGPAGAAAAITLASAGVKVTLLERSHVPADEVCGDFVSADALAALDRLGVAVPDATLIRTLRLVHQRRVVETDLPFRAVGVPRRVLDEVLLRRAEACGAIVLRGYAVQRLERTGSGFALHGRDGARHARTVFLASGKHNLRGAPRSGARAKSIGLKIYLHLPAKAAQMLHEVTTIELIDGGYAGLQLVGADRAVLCLLTSGGRLAAMAGTWRAMRECLCHTAPRFASLLSHAEPCCDRPLAISGMPYGYLHDDASVAGFYRLGDQAAVIPSVAGDGIAIALYSGVVAARCYLEGRSAAEYRRVLRRRLGAQMRIASVLQGAIVSPSWQGPLVLGAGLLPGVVRSLAMVTRVSSF